MTSKRFKKLPEKTLELQAELLDKLLPSIKKNCTSKEPSHILMKKYNPLVIPRNHIVEEALNLAQEGDLSLFTEFLDALRSPYNIEDIPNRFLDPPSKDQRVYQTFCGT